MSHCCTFCSSAQPSFYDGALHLLLSPADLLGLLAVTLLAGLCGEQAGRWTVIVLPAAWFAAELIGLYGGVTIELPWAGVLSLVVLGIAATVLIIALLVPAAVVSPRAAWMRVAVRVAGSWVAAVGMLMLGWLARGTA